MEDFIKEVLLAFVAAGGCGYLNYYVLTCTNVIEEQDRADKERLYLMILSLFNILVCFFFSDYLKWNIYKSVLITFLLTLISSFTVHAHVIKLFRTLVNLIRKGK